MSQEKDQNHQEEYSGNENQPIFEYFQKQRKYWNDTLQPIFNALNIYSKIPEAQVYLYTYRQQILEISTTLAQQSYLLNGKYKKQYSERFDHYAMGVNYDYKSHIGKKVSADLSNIEERLDLIDSQVKFLNETLKTIDSSLYGIQYRVRIDDAMCGVGGLQQKK